MSTFGQLKEKIVNYLDVRVRLMKLSAIERTSMVLSSFIFYIVLMFIGFCIILFLGFGLKEMFVSFGLSDTVSYLLTSAIYLLLLFVAMALRRRISGFFANEIVKIMTAGDNGETDEDE